MGKIIGHIDLNAFFASAEEIRHPELIGKPIAIGGEGRSGVVSTANYVARKFGVHSAQPTFQAKALCPDLLILPGDFDYYRMMSHSFFGRVKEIFPVCEMASIDEAYVDMSERLRREKDPPGFLKAFQTYLKNETGLSCSIGVAPTKWLAKMGSDMKKPMGLTFLRRRDLASTIHPLPIESFWGIGKKTAPLLRELGIATIGDLHEALERGDPAILKCLGKFAATAREWCAGRGDDVVCLQEADQKSLSMSETLERDISSPEEGREKLREIVHALCEKAKDGRKVVSNVSLALKDTSFRVHQKSRSFAPPTRKESVLYPLCYALMEEGFASLKGQDARLIGVTFAKLEDEARQTVQMNFWNYEEYEELDKTKLLINELNRKSEKVQFRRAREAKGDGHDPR